LQLRQRDAGQPKSLRASVTPGTEAPAPRVSLRGGEPFHATAKRLRQARQRAGAVRGVAEGRVVRAHGLSQRDEEVVVRMPRLAHELTILEKQHGPLMEHLNRIIDEMPAGVRRLTGWEEYPVEFSRSLHQVANALGYGTGPDTSRS